MSHEPYFKIGQLVALRENCPYIVSTANRSNLFEIKPEMVGLFLGYAETMLNAPIAVVLFGDITLTIFADKLRTYHD